MILLDRSFHAYENIVLQYWQAVNVRMRGQAAACRLNRSTLIQVVMDFIHRNTKCPLCRTFGATLSSSELTDT